VTAPCLKRASLVALGLLLMQLAWILAVPPFQAADEFDHAYRAAAVARGEWRMAEKGPETGHGNIVTAPIDIVEAARPVCESYDYTGPVNCQGADRVGDGLILVQSGAATYNPLFYWLIGTPARAFSGADALYAMRVAGALLSTLLIFLAAACALAGSRSVWPTLGLAVALTPVAVFSTAMAAPNGIEIVAAVAVWCGLLRIVQDRDHVPLATVTVVAGGVVLAVVRLMGPIWLALVVLACVALARREAYADLWNRHRRLMFGAVAVVAAALLFSAWWILSAGQGSVVTGGPEAASNADPVGNSLERMPLWVLQSIAAFPTKSDSAPLIVYAFGFIAFAQLMVLAWRYLSPRARMSIAAVAVLAIAVGLLVSIATYAKVGDFWQGRYGLPLAAGMPLIAGFGIDGLRDLVRLERPVALSASVLLCLGATISVVSVQHQQLGSSALAHSAEWRSHPLWLLALLTVAGWAIWGWVLKSSLSRVENGVRQEAVVSQPA
jgi:hypothetical protein